jgi:hypothetical protein
MGGEDLEDFGLRPTPAKKILSQQTSQRSGHAYKPSYMGDIQKSPGSKPAPEKKQEIPYWKQ